MSARRQRVTVTIDPAQPRPKDIARYLGEIAAHLAERPERLRIAFDSPPGITLDLAATGELVIQVMRHPPYRFALRGWIADHPVPLALKDAVLYADPAAGGRFRVWAPRRWRQMWARLRGA